MVRKRVSALLGIAAVVFGVTAILGTPVANADTLSNGLTVSCTQDSDVHASCVIGGCARVNGDYVIDAVHIKLNGGPQDEQGFKCINGATARTGIDNNRAPVDVGVQGCRKKDLEGDWCGPWANYTFTPPAKPAQQAPPVNCPNGTTVPAGQQCPAVVAQPVNCPDGTTVPAGQQCPAPKPVTDAISLSFGAPGLGSITATITNSSDLKGKCTYDATGLANTHRDFNVGPHGSTTLTFNGFNTGSSYHVVVSCLDASGKQTEPIGTASQDVRF